jgi:hypothetical protein
VLSTPRKGLPKEWTADQIRSFQDYLDSLMSGNLARIICYAFSVPVSPFVSQVNRATRETMRQKATQEGLVPLKAWV